MFGFDTAVIAGTTATLQAHYGLTEAEKGFTVAIALYGTVLGALTCGPLGQRIGARAALRWMSVLYVLSAIGCALAGPWWSLLAFRFIGGVAIGGSSVLGPVYIAELSPAKWRGRLVGLFQLNLVIGILLAYLSNAIVSHFVLGPTQWRWELGVAVLPSLLFMVLLFTVPHSSRWLVSQNRLDEAQRILIDMGSPDSDAEIEAIQNSLADEGGRTQTTLFQRRYALLLFVAISAGAFTMFTGINAILYYLNDIFHDAGFSAVSAAEQSVMIGLANLVATIVGLSLIDKIGRKKLLLIASVGMAIVLSAVAAVFQSGAHNSLLLPLLIAYICFFAVGQGAVIWVYLSEVFPNNVRSKGQSMGSASHWVFNALISNIFPVVALYSKALPFWFFAGCMVVQFFVVLWVYPETAGVTLENMGHNAHLH
jgi:SP family arabinose:H+ symporter-like MFS transporter